VNYFTLLLAGSDKFPFLPLLIRGEDTPRTVYVADQPCTASDLIPDRSPLPCIG